jgi:bifunctional non-homologous end joining protein LigD
MAVELNNYHSKRDFSRSPEPFGGKSPKSAPGLRFVVQKHYATRLHYDLRLELDGVLKSWAVPKGPTLDPAVKRLALMVEDHPSDYLFFEGLIPAGQYGAGAVLIWDEGTYRADGCDDPEQSAAMLREGLARGELTFILEGGKLKGKFALVKMRDGDNNWLLIKGKDDYAVAGFYPEMFDDPFPQKVKPMLATPVAEPFNHPDWIFEIKFDGYRTIAACQKGRVELYSRNLQSFNRLFAPVAEALAGSVDAVYDGEIVVLDEKGRSRFQLLQNYTQGAPGELVYFVFDLLYLEGRDLRSLPLVARKEKLQKFLPQHPRLQYVSHIEEAGREFFAAAVEHRLEGIIAKQKNSRYREGKRGKEWIKIKVALRQEAIICGFTRPKGGRLHFGSLVLGACRDGEFVHIGNCGTGFSTAALEQIYTLLQPLICKESPFANKIKGEEHITWVEPVYVCEVKFTEQTSEGLLRHPVFLGIKEKKAGTVCGKSENFTHKNTGKGGNKMPPGKTAGLVTAQGRKDREVTVNGQLLRLTNLDKVYWPEEGYTKGDVINYYHSVAPYILPYLKDRPQSLYRTPNGITGGGFYQKDVSSFAPDWLETYAVAGTEGEKEKLYLLCQNEQTLIYMANLGCIEINPWLSRIQNPENPDYLVIDLDPENIPFEKVIDAARAVRELLDFAGIESFPKTSGATGMHIYLPLGAMYSYDIAKEYARLLAMLVHRIVPDFTSLERSPKKRRGKVYLDYLQNRSGQTLASVYSLRPRRGATVSTPLLWEEVKPGLDPQDFTIKTVRKRLEKKGDLFRGVLGPGVNIAESINKLKGALSGRTV